MTVYLFTYVQVYVLMYILSMCMLLSGHQNAGQNQDIKIANRCFENVAQFRYLGTDIRNKSQPDSGGN
jgi:hypothetical protein